MNNSLTELQRLIVDAVDDKKAFDVVILDLRNRTDITDYFIICSGNSRLQVQAMCGDAARVAGDRPLRNENAARGHCAAGRKLNV